MAVVAEILDLVTHHAGLPLTAGGFAVGARLRPVGRMWDVHPVTILAIAGLMAHLAIQLPTGRPFDLLAVARESLPFGELPRGALVGGRDRSYLFGVAGLACSGSYDALLPMKRAMAGEAGLYRYVLGLTRLVRKLRMARLAANALSEVGRVVEYELSLQPPILGRVSRPGV
jgi:hypothetical protein